MAETYTSKYASGAVVDAALDKAGTALQPGDVVNALNSTSTTAPLSAAQGKALADGKISGPASATDNAIARFDGTTGKLVQDSANATMADNGALTLATGSVTDPQPILNLSQTWNNANKTFTGIKANITDTASKSDSLLMDLQVGGSSKFKIDKNGRISSENFYVGSVYAMGSNDIGIIGRIFGVNNSYITVGVNGFFTIATNGKVGIFMDFPTPNVYLPSDVAFGFNSGALSTDAATPDVTLYRDAANTLAQRRSTIAQESRLYGSYTSATAYQRLSTKTIREAVTCAAGASVTTTISIPKYTHLVGVTTRVTTAIGTTNSTTGYTVGDGTDADLWGAITGTAQGTTSDRRDFTAVDALGPDGADRTITLTAVGGNFDGTGVIEVCAYYLAAEAD